jgi:TM2 domain-containing membrane protein YozV
MNDSTESNSSQDQSAPLADTNPQPAQELQPDTAPPEATPPFEAAPAPQDTPPYPYTDQQGYQQAGFSQEGQAAYQQSYQQAPPYAQQQGYQPPPAAAYAPQPEQHNAAQSVRTQGIGSAHKDKWAAAVLAFVLGFLGIHKFYLGYKNEGIIMLVVCIVGTPCFGLGPLVMMIVALIEAVKYITLTQQDFEYTYVIGSKGWF